jgi:hypothetical protein
MLLLDVLGLPGQKPDIFAKAYRQSKSSEILDTRDEPHLPWKRALAFQDSHRPQPAPRLGKPSER